MSAFVKAATAALQEIPAVNGVIDDETNEIVYRNYCDVSVAVASPNGLVVPVLRNTEKMSFSVRDLSLPSLCALPGFSATCVSFPFCFCLFMSSAWLGC
jgi:hypothetical protein